MCFQYINAAEKNVYLVDPARRSTELTDSDHAAKRIWYLRNFNHSAYINYVNLCHNSGTGSKRNVIKEAMVRNRLTV